MTPFEQQLQHLIQLASVPGWRAYAWARAQELDGDQSCLWTGIAQALVVAMRSRTGQDVRSE